MDKLLTMSKKERTRYPIGSDTAGCRETTETEESG
jgi:hypothetical protein